MIRVIEHGHYRTYSCYKCRCIFTFEKEDVKVEQTSMNEYRSFVECPDCRERNTVSL